MYTKNFPRVKVFSQVFFKKLAGFGAEPQKNGAFLFAKLFLLRLLCQKKKRKNDGWCCNDSAHNVRNIIIAFDTSSTANAVPLLPLEKAWKDVKLWVDNLNKSKKFKLFINQQFKVSYKLAFSSGRRCHR